MVAWVTPRLALRTPRVEDAPAALDFHVRNRAHLAPWSPPAPAQVNTLYYWQAVAVQAAHAFDDGTMVRLWFFAHDAPSVMLGTIGFSQIHRGPFCNAVLGYSIDAQAEGKGLMHEALEAAITYMFNEQKLHRISANYRPENTRSGRLLARLGFRIEGFAEQYLFIDGAWRDHILTSRTHHGFDTSVFSPS